MDEEAIFTTALEMESADRRVAYLDEACAGNAGLRRRVEELLCSHGRAGSYLDNAAAAWNAHLPFGDQQQSMAERPGTLVGPYKLLEQIGEGGMGLVYVAEQQRPVKRCVALKIIKPGMDSRQVVARFEAERQALALMDHPNIAKIFDAGMTDAGRPYFVMELVQGIPITDYSDQARLSVRQRLDVFVQVCRAVQHAHTKGVIHRDLKPSNVLVTSHDGVPVPIIIDFGVAKALGQQLTERTLHTCFAQMIGSPLYMSPEQAEFNQLGVDTRSDIYSLGVLLYELLTGATPFDGERLRTVAHDEFRRILREEEPPRPSARLSTLGAALSTASERRRVDPRELTRTLHGELDWIVLKSLEKDRTRRYETANDFAADVQRHLNDEPVTACPPSAGYRVGKYIRRNRRALVMVGVVAVALVAATLVSTWQALVARDALGQAQTARKDAEADRDRARTAEIQAKIEQDRTQKAERSAATEAAVARAVNEFLQVDLLGQAASLSPPDEEFSENRYLTVKEALDRASARIGQRFQDQPLVEAAIRTAIGTGYHNLYELQLVVPHLERAVALRKTHLGPDHPDTLGSMDSLSEAYMWVGRHADAITLRRRLLENRKALLGPDHSETMSRIFGLAIAYQHAGQLDTSSRFLEQLLEQQRSICGPTHPATLGTMPRLAQVYGFMNRLPEAIALFEKYFTQAAYGPEHGVTPELMSFIQVCQWAGKFNQADCLLREALKQSRKGQGSVDQRNRTANILGYLAVNLLLQERYDEAEPFAREAVAMKQIGDTKRYYWVSVLGAVLLGQRKYAEAEPLLLKGYEGLKQEEGFYPPIRRRMSEVRGWVVRFYEATNQPEKARAWQEEPLKGKSEK